MKYHKNCVYRERKALEIPRVIQCNITPTLFNELKAFCFALKKAMKALLKDFKNKPQMLSIDQLVLIEARLDFSLS